jgi:hypothetical protein
VSYHFNLGECNFHIFGINDPLVFQSKDNDNSIIKKLPMIQLA